MNWRRLLGTALTACADVLDQAAYEVQRRPTKRSSTPNLTVKRARKAIDPPSGFTGLLGRETRSED